MRLHRFYINPAQHVLTNQFWLHDAGIVSQWQRVLRYKPGQHVVLFDGVEHERLYEIAEFDTDAAHLKQITEMSRKLPLKDIYLAWALLKKDKNEWVLQKCTELGVNHFIPILTERCEKTGFNEDRAKKIVIEASEQCGRGNIPSLREPMQLSTLLDEFSGKLPVIVCEQSGQTTFDTTVEKAVVVVGPEGGWTDQELELFSEKNVLVMSMGELTHRAETASIAAISKLL